MTKEEPQEKRSEDLKEIDDLLYQAKMTRRMAISTAGKVGIAAGASAVIFGLGGYFAGTSQVPPPAGERMTTVTQERTVTMTATQERTATVTAEKTITVTPAAPAPGPADEKLRTFIVAWNTEFDFMDPRKTFTLTPYWTAWLCYDRFLQYDIEGLKRGEYILVPSVATKLPEIQQDGRTLIFPMRKDVKFGRTGNPVNAQAVKFTLDTILALKGPGSFPFAVIKEAKVIDEFTAQVDLKSLYAPAPQLFAFGGSSIVDPADLTAHQEGGDFGSKWLDQGNTAGSGPFILEKFTREVEYVMVRNKNFNTAYRQASARTDRIIIKHIPEPTDQNFLLQRGDVDVAYSLSVEQFNALRGRTDILTQPFPIFRFAYLALDWDHFKRDVRLMKAVKLALDYDGIVKGVTGGLHEINQSPILKPLLGWDAKFANYFKTDVAKAKQLLADAGFKDGFDVELSFISSFVTAGVDQGKLAQKIQADLQEAGFKVKLVGEAFAPWVEKMRTGKLQLWLGGISSAYADPEYHASYWPAIAKPRLHWENEEINKINEDAKTALDPKKRAELYAKYQETYLEIGPTINLFQIRWPMAMRSNVKGFVFNALNGNMTEPTVFKE